MPCNGGSPGAESIGETSRCGQQVGKRNHFSEEVLRGEIYRVRDGGIDSHFKLLDLGSGSLGKNLPPSNGSQSVSDYLNGA